MLAAFRTPFLTLLACLAYAAKTVDRVSQRVRRKLRFIIRADRHWARFWMKDLGVLRPNGA